MRKSKFLSAVVLGVTLVAGSMLLTGCGSGKKIDVSKYITFEESGYDGYGVVSATFDHEKFEKDYAKVKVSNKSNEEYKLIKAFGATDVEVLESMIDGRLDKYNNVSNGETVTYKVNVDSSLDELFKGYKVKSTEVTHKVSGLKEVEKFNPFDELQIGFSGDENNRTFRYSKPSTEMWDDISVSCKKTDSSNSYSLRAGDKVKITISIDTDKFISKYNKAPSETEKEITVTGFDKYITSYDDISESEQKSAQILGLNGVKKSYEKNNTVKNLNVEYAGSYLKSSDTGKPVRYGWGTAINKYYLVYKVSHEINVNNVSYGNVEYYVLLTYTNIERDTNGFVYLGSYNMSGKSMNCGISNLPYTANVTGYESMEDIEKAVNDITSDMTVDKRI